MNEFNTILSIFNTLLTIVLLLLGWVIRSEIQEKLRYWLGKNGKIISARYGIGQSPNQSIEVTNKVRRLLRNGKGEFVVSNDHFEDPYFGKVKQLFVTFELHRKRYEFAILEDQLAQFPPTHLEEKRTPDFADQFLNHIIQQVPPSDWEQVPSAQLPNEFPHLWVTSVYEHTSLAKSIITQCIRLENPNFESKYLLRFLSPDRLELGRLSRERTLIRKLFFKIKRHIFDLEAFAHAENWIDAPQED